MNQGCMKSFEVDFNGYRNFDSSQYFLLMIAQGSGVGD